MGNVFCSGQLSKIYGLGKRMNIKQITVYGLVFIVMQSIISCGIFVTFPQMTAYAASKDDLTSIHSQLQRIEEKIDKLILGY